ncbi:MAG: GTPase, partial [Frankiaceae bacterium]
MPPAGFDLARIRQLAFGVELPAPADEILRAHTAEVGAQLADLAAALDGLRRLPHTARDSTARDSTARDSTARDRIGPATLPPTLSRALPPTPSASLAPAVEAGASAVLDDLAAVLADCRRRLNGPGTAVRVVFMGRTLAGKSTLYEALTDGDGRRIGTGAQRATRDCAEHAAAVLRPGLDHCDDLGGLVVVDPPGVGALDGEQDVEAAFDAAKGSDLIAWVATTDSTQEETARALRMIAAAGRAVVVIVNCRADIDTPARRRRFLREPDRAFADLSAHLGPVLRALDSAGAAPVATVAVHARAAFDATRVAEPDVGAPLWAASRIGDLLDVLRAHGVRAASQRRLLRSADLGRDAVDAGTGMLADLADRLGRDEEVAAAAAQDLARRVQAVFDDALMGLRVAAYRLADERRSWVHQQNVRDKRAVERAWATLHYQVAAVGRSLLQEHTAQLRAALDECLRAFDHDWSVPLTDPANRPLFFQPMASAWVHTGVKSAGAAAGGVVGLSVGGLPGAAVGLVLGWALPQVADRLAGRFRSREQVMRDRRASLAGQLNAYLDWVRETWVQTFADGVLRPAWQRFEAEQSVLAARRAGEQRLAAATADLARQCKQRRAVLDAAAARALLGLAGRPRAAAAIGWTYRLPGVGMAAVVGDPEAIEELSL